MVFAGSYGYDPWRGHDVTETEWLADRFEQQRPQLRAIAYRMLGSLSEADDAVQEAWVRLSRSDASSIDNLGGWLTTVVSRVALNMLRARKARREESLEARLPDPIVSVGDASDPEHEALIADSVGLALLVVLEELAPAERLAFVLHDMFGVPFGEIAEITERSPEAARQLASRARRRVHGAAPVPDPDLAEQRRVVDAFLAASREGDFDALVAVLDPDVVLHHDREEGRLVAPQAVHGARTVASRALLFNRLSPYTRPALVNGAAGVIVAPGGETFAIMAFTVTDGRIAEIVVLSDPDRIRELERA
jgi:RNA polymerase sigma-70 factor (ECF subfamily)